MPTDNPLIRRLARLEAYRRLTPLIRTAVRIHLSLGLPGEEAATLAGADNPARSWNSPRVAECIRAYRGEDADETTVDDLVLEFERADQETAKAAWLGPQPEKTVPEPPPIAPERPVEPAAPPVDIPAPPTPAKRLLQREPGQPIVLCGESYTDVTSLFPHLDEVNRRYWRQQVEDQQAERARLIKILEVRNGQ